MSLKIATAINVYLFVVFVVISPSDCAADNESANEAHITVPVGIADWNRSCYAKSFPSNYHGQDGVTYIYKLHEPDDTLIVKHNWYSKEIFLHCSICNEDGKECGISVIRMGPWPRGSRPSDKHLSIAFYLGGKLLKQYSTLDIASGEENFMRSVSHYTVIMDTLGYRWIKKKTREGTGFSILTHGNNRIDFDPATVEIIRRELFTTTK